MSERANGRGPRLLSALWRNRFVLVSALVLYAALGFLLSQQQQERWEASSRVFFGVRGEFDPVNQGDFINDPNRFLVNQAEVMVSRPVLQRVVSDTGSDEPLDQLEQRISATATGDSDVVVVSAEAGTPDEAVVLADAVVTAYRDFVTTKVGTTVADAVEQTPDPSAVAGIRAAAAVYGDGITLVEPAVAGGSPRAPAPVRDAVLAGVMGLFIAVAIVIGLEMRGGRDGWVARAAVVLDAPLLARVRGAGADRGGPLVPPDSQAAVAYRTAGVALSYSGGQHLESVVVTGRDGASVSAVTLNLAAASASLGSRVAVVFAHTVPGATAVVDEAGTRRLPGRADVAVLSGPPGTEAMFLLGAQSPPGGQEYVMSKLGDALSLAPVDTDLVFVDTPPLSSRPESFALLGQSTGAVVVVDPLTRREDLELIRERCVLAGTDILGFLAVDNAATGTLPAALRRLRRLAVDRRRRNGRLAGTAAGAGPGARDADPAIHSETPDHGAETPADESIDGRPTAHR